MRRYEIEYEGVPLATVDIEESEAAETISEMVEFWMGWQRDLEKHNGDYTTTWLHSLAKFILRYNSPPGDEDEGWCKLDGSNGIHLIDWDIWEHDYDLISIG